MLGGGERVEACILPAREDDCLRDEHVAALLNRGRRCVDGREAGSMHRRDAGVLADVQELDLPNAARTQAARTGGFYL